MGLEQSEFYLQICSYFCCTAPTPPEVDWAMTTKKKQKLSKPQCNCKDTVTVLAWKGYNY